MTRLLNARLASGELVTVDIADGRIAAIVPAKSHPSPASAPSIDLVGDWLVPAGVDMHVHSRDPGLTAKETWAGLARAASAGGVAWVGDMPNTVPAVTTREAVIQKARLAEATGIGFGIYLGVTEANLSEIPKILEDRSLPVRGLKVYYGASTGDLMFSRLERLSAAWAEVPEERRPIVVFHAEDQSLIDANAVRCRFDIDATRGINPSDPSWGSGFRTHSRVRDAKVARSAVERVLRWAPSWGGATHIAHVSTSREVEMIAAARSHGARVTCEVAPHHLLFSEDDYDRLGGLIKVNPPVRSTEERDRLRRLVGQRLVDVFATDHAPHTWAEKRRDAPSVPSGISSIEFFWPLLVAATSLCGLTMEDAVSMGAKRPGCLMGISSARGGDYGTIEVGSSANLVRLSARPMTVTRKEIVSSCGFSPYDGMSLPARVVSHWREGRLVFQADGV